MTCLCICVHKTSASSFFLFFASFFLHLFNSLSSILLPHPCLPPCVAPSVLPAVGGDSSCFGAAVAHQACQTSIVQSLYFCCLSLQLQNNIQYHGTSLALLLSERPLGHMVPGRSRQRRPECCSALSAPCSRTNPERKKEQEEDCEWQQLNKRPETPTSKG